ncbi:MAG: sortase [Oscillospiraceae bacterium]
MKTKLGGALMIAGLALILAAVGLVAYNTLESGRGGSYSAEALIQVQAYEQEQAAVFRKVPLPPETLELLTEMPVAEIDGYVYVGSVTIPALELELPVMNTWDYSRMKLAPCRYTGSVYTDDLVVCGHSYRSHFGRLSQLQPGDEVLFTCMDGAVFTYRVAVVEILRPTAIDEMVNSGYPLTLFTCTTDSQARVTVRCEAVESE